MNSDFVASIFQLIAKISKIMCRAINTLVPASHPLLAVIPSCSDALPIGIMHFDRERI